MADDGIIVPPVIRLPTHGGQTMPHIAATEMVVGSYEWKTGKFAVSICLFNPDRNHGYVSVQCEEDIGKLIQLLLDAKMNCGRLERGESFIPTTNLGSKQ